MAVARRRQVRVRSGARRRGCQWRRRRRRQRRRRAPSAALRARAYEYLGMSWLILGKKPRAREAFEELLAIDPHYTLSDPSRSPKLREFFDDVRASFLPGYGRAEGEAELEHAAPTAATAGRPI